MQTFNLYHRFYAVPKRKSGCSWPVVNQTVDYTRVYSLVLVGDPELSFKTTQDNLSSVKFPWQ